MEKSLIVVGAGWAGITIASTILEFSSSKLIGFAEDDEITNPVIVPNNNGGHPVPILGPSSKLAELAKQYKAEGIIIAVTNNRQDHLLKQIIKCHELQIPLYEMPDLYATLTQKVPVRHLSHQWIVPNLVAPKFSFYLLFQVPFNYVLSLMGFLLVLVPLCPFIAMAIKLDSIGTVFYCQSRIGKRGIPFKLLKFRTMYQNSDENATKWTSAEDERITRVGRWLRKFRLDELPQLWNVLKGEMALIGPRPEATELVKMFEQEIPFYEYRNLVLPGITGWAQVNHGNTCSIEGALEKLQYDFYWIKNRSFWLDLKTIFKSIKVVLTGFGAI